MKVILGLVVAVATLGAIPAAAGDIEAGQNLALLQYPVTVGMAPAARAESDRSAALIKEGESESPETLALIENNREDRERTVVMDR